MISLEPHVSATDVKSKIEAALKRSAELDARRINATVTYNKVILSGNVHSWFERNDARHAARVTALVNRLCRATSQAGVGTNRLPFRLRFRYLGHRGFGQQQHACNRHGVLECEPDDLSRIDDAGFVPI